MKHIRLLLMNLQGNLRANKLFFHSQGMTSYNQTPERACELETSRLKSIRLW